MKISLLPVLTLLGLAALPLRAQDPDSAPGIAIPGLESLTPGAAGKGKSQASLFAEVKSIAPGQPFTVALELSHPPKWHSYYLNSGGIEQSPAFQWILPEGFSAAPAQWPTPEVKEAYGMISFIYSGKPVFLFEITPPADLAPGSPVELTLDASWQICEMSCSDESAKLKLSLPVAASAEPDAALADTFARARAALPKPTGAWAFQAQKTGDRYELTVTPPGEQKIDFEKLDFIPDQPFASSLSAKGNSLRTEGSSAILELARITELLNGQSVPDGPAISGILVSSEVLDPATGAKSILVPVTTFGAAAAGTPGASPASGGSSKGILGILGGMLAGGLILNLMPCVFPVIGLKIMGFVQQAGSDRRKIMLHGIFFSLGVLISFWILAGVLYYLRSIAPAGETRGWGYQLQEPWVVLGLMLLMFVLGLSMFGLFEIGASATSFGGKLQSQDGLTGTFFSGVLATVVATPCSAPFLGVAIGAAMTLPAFGFFLAFTFMALGLALPYLILSIFPKLVDALPRPGPWMETFKQAMSFLLLATAGYLLWVYFTQIKLENGLNPIIGLTAIAIACWIFGRWHRPISTRRTKQFARVFTILFAAGGIALCAPPKPSALTWETWSPQLEAELRGKNIPVYIDFTATWCVTCQVNKKNAYSDEVVQLMLDRGIRTLKADKSSPNPEIEEALRKLERSAIPVNVLYAPGKGPLITPELLTPGYLKDLIEKEVPAKK